MLCLFIFKKFLINLYIYSIMALEFLTSNLSKYKKLLKYLDPKHRNNKNAVKIAVIGHPSAMKYASDELKNNKRFIISILNETENCDLLEWVSKELKNDKSFIMEAIEICDTTFAEGKGDMGKWILSSELKNDKEVILGIINKELFEISETFSLQHFSDELKNDMEIVLAFKDSGGGLERITICIKQYKG